ncbi:ATPase, T2SS/T4P/T4SS family [Marinitoga sp. 38H-ov]|uniref:GspE/PulE family protein n=1 Tax=Marinitoga sp. 38H-ov TaxID=1755814 RepID=UPI0013EC3C3E|nr:ATPase, T2SS/T4P/T4SS family [Marinitoga sp. 38H-ov]
MKNRISELATKQLFTNCIVKDNSISSTYKINLFEKYLKLLLEDKVTDLHFSIQNNFGIISYRYNTMLIEYEKLPLEDYNKIITKIQILSGIDIINDRDPADGSFTFYDNRFRVSMIRDFEGINCVIRKLKTISDLKNLNYSNIFLNYVEKILNMNHGLILFSGPTGSGKTTALAYLLINILKKEPKKIITIENPIEYKIPKIEQIEINNDSKKTSIIKNILRHDPDIIMTGEIRTKEIADITIESAMTGHLVLSTIHANNVFGVIERLKKMGIMEYDILNTVKVIFNQRFVKILCDCYKDKNNKGCEKCRYTGYINITPIFEILEINEHSKKQIKNNDIISDEYYYNPLEEIKQLYIKGKISDSDYKSLLMG